MSQWVTYARDAFFLLRGFTGASLPASAPASLAGARDSATDADAAVTAPAAEAEEAVAWSAPFANWASASSATNSM